MAKTPEAVRGLLEKVWKPAREAALADRDAMQALIARGGRQLQARRLGLALLRREAAQAPLRFRGVRGQAVLPARPRDRGGVLRRAEAVRPDVQAGRRAGLASRRAGLGGARRRRQARRHFLSATISRARASTAAPGWARLRDQEKLARRRAPDRAQRDELQQGRSDAAVVRGRPHAVPRDGPRRCTAFCPTSPIRRCPAPAC